MGALAISLLLEDGTAQGLRTATVGSWNGLAIVCPRAELERLRDRREAHRTGVYLLIGPSEKSATGLAVYVGEGDDVWQRLVSHDESKEFWTWVAIFITTDESLTKAHVRWLEAALVRDITAAKRAEKINGNDPKGGYLPPIDLVVAETFLANARLLLPTVGADVFSVTAVSSTTAGAPAELRLVLRWDGAEAECAVRDGQFVVMQGSTARVTEVESLADYRRALRKRLRDSGVLAPDAGDDKLLVFSQDFRFESPTAAAEVVAGNPLSGPAHWKVKGKKGLSYKDWQEQQLGIGVAAK